LRTAKKRKAFISGELINQLILEDRSLFDALVLQAGVEKDDEENMEGVVYITRYTGVLDDLTRSSLNDF